MGVCTGHRCEGSLFENKGYDVRVSDTCSNLTQGFPVQKPATLTVVL